MRSRAFLALALLASLALAGCASRAPAAEVGRDGLDFPVVSRLHGVSNATTGDIALATSNGLVATGDAPNATVRLGLGGLVTTRGVVQACHAACLEHEAPDGFVIAEGALVSLHNLSLNAVGPDANSGVFFYDDGDASGEFIGWNDATDTFDVSNNLTAYGEITGIGRIGTTTPFPGLGPNGEDVALATAALEGLEGAIFLRGSAALRNGTATIEFPTAFAVLVGDGPITVQVTLTSRGVPVFVSEKTRERITVETVDGSPSSATFDLFVQAPRKGAEDFQPLRRS